MVRNAKRNLFTRNPIVIKVHEYFEGMPCFWAMSMNHKNLDILPSLYDYYTEVQILMMNDPRGMDFVHWFITIYNLSQSHYAIPRCIVSLQLFYVSSFSATFDTSSSFSLYHIISRYLRKYNIFTIQYVFSL